jgi:hypothetical protein
MFIKSKKIFLEIHVQGDGENQMQCVNGAIACEFQGME